MSLPSPTKESAVKGIFKDPFFEDYRVFWGNVMTYGLNTPEPVSTETLVKTNQHSIDERFRRLFETERQDIESAFGELCETYVQEVTAKIATQLPEDLATFYAAALYFDLDHWEKYFGNEAKAIDQINEVMYELKEKRVAAMSSMSSAQQDGQKLDLSAHEEYIEKLLG